MSKTHETDYAAKIEALRSAIDAGITDVERGNFKEFATGRELTDYLRSLRRRTAIPTP